MGHIRGLTMPAPQNSPAAPIRLTANVICLGLILMVLLDFAVSGALYFLANLFISGLGITSAPLLSAISIFCEIAVAAFVIAVPMSLIRMFIGIPARAAFPMRTPRASVAIPAVGICLGVSVGGALITSTILMIITAVFGATPPVPVFSQPRGVVAAVLYFVRIAMIPAVFEELMFRGVIMQSLRRFGDPFALVCSSLLFALAHRNLTQGPNAFITGLAIGFFVLRTGSLKTGMLIHFVNNALTILVDTLTKNLAAGEFETAVLIVFAVYLTLGLIGLAVIILNHGNIFHLSLSNYPLLEKYKYISFFTAAATLVYAVLILFLMIRGFH